MFTLSPLAVQLTVQVTLICSNVELRKTTLAVTLKAAGPNEQEGETQIETLWKMLVCVYSCS